MVKKVKIVLDMILILWDTCIESKENNLKIRIKQKTEIERIKKENHVFIASDDDLAAVVRENRLESLLIRCGDGRLVCPAQDVKNFVKMINNHETNYVRDISFPVSR